MEHLIKGNMRRGFLPDVYKRQAVYTPAYRMAHQCQVCRGSRCFVKTGLMCIWLGTGLAHRMLIYGGALAFAEMRPDPAKGTGRRILPDTLRKCLGKGHGAA